MVCNDDHALTCDLAGVIVATAAPEDRAVFPVLSEAYFVPGGKDRWDEEPEFDDAEVTRLPTPRPFTHCRTRNYFSIGGP